MLHGCLDVRAVEVSVSIGTRCTPSPVGPLCLSVLTTAHQDDTCKSDVFSHAMMTPMKMVLDNDVDFVVLYQFPSVEPPCTGKYVLPYKSLPRGLSREI